MGKVKELVEEEINCAIEDYVDEVGLDYGWKDHKSLDTLRKDPYIRSARLQAKVRLVSKLHAIGIDEDRIEEIVDEVCV